MSTDLIQSFTRLDTWLTKGLPGNIDPKDEAAKIRSYIEQARTSPFTIMTYAKHLETFNKGLDLLDKATTCEKSSEAPKKVIPITTVVTFEVEESSETTPSNGPSLGSTIFNGTIAVPKFLLVTVPTVFLSWVSSSKSTSVETSDGKKTMPAEVIHVREEVASPEDASRFKLTNRPPVGLNNENGNDCFLNAVRQFIYNTPIAEHVLPTLPTKITETTPKAYPNTLQDCKDYHNHSVGSSMGGSRKIRNELLPEYMLHGQHDAHEALAHLFFYTKPNCPLNSRLEGTRTYDLSTLPRGITYDNFTREGKNYFQIGHQHNHGLNISTINEPMLLLPIKTEGKQTLNTLQEVWDHHMNPTFERTTPTTSADEFGALLEDSTTITREMLNSGRIAMNRHGKYKVLPDQVAENFRFVEAPEHLLFSLKRFTRTYDINTKIDDAVEMDPTFTLDHNHIKNGQAANYQIEAFIVQSGGTSGGHYVSYIYDAEKKQWYRCNDSHVTPISTSNAKAAMRKAYSFYAKRVGNPYTSAHHRAIATPAKPPRRDVSVMPRSSKTHYGLVGKSAIGTRPTSTTFKGDFAIGSVNQLDILDGRDSAHAQATRFLARVFNGKTVTRDSLRTLLDENVQARQTQTASSRSTRLEEAQSKVTNELVDEIKDLVITHKGCQIAGAPPEHLAQLLLSRTKEIITAYHSKHKLTEPSAILKQLPTLVEKHLEGKMNQEQLVTEMRSLIRQDRVAPQLDKADPSSEIDEVYSAFQNAFGNAELPLRETCYLESDSGMRQAVLRSKLTEKKEEFLDTNKSSAVGTVFSCNGSTHAVALFKQESGKVLYRIFDPQGNKEVTGSPNAFIFETTDEGEAAKVLGKLVIYLPLERETSIEELNRLSSYTFVPAGENKSSAWTTFGSSLYSFGAFTVSGVYSMTTTPFRGLAYLGRSISSSCRSKPAPIKLPVEVKVDFTSKESVGTELARIRSEVLSFVAKRKTYTAPDIARLREALDRVAPASHKYPELGKTATDLATLLESFARNLPPVSTPSVSTPMDHDSPANIGFRS